MLLLGIVETPLAPPIAARDGSYMNYCLALCKGKSRDSSRFRQSGKNLV
jgi:hypothetical protein